jgi:Domain of unknown function (DUF4214)
MRKWWNSVRTTPVKPARRQPGRRLCVEPLEARLVLTNAQFVTALYQDILNRAPDQGGLSFYTNALDTGQLTRAQVVSAIETSAEHQTNIVNNLYQTLLARVPTPTELQAGLNILASGGSSTQIEGGILSSDEYFNLNGGTNVGFVTALYRDVLHRTPDTAGLNAYVSALDAGASRQSVVNAFLTSQENETNQVNTLFTQLLGRAPTTAELNAGIAALQTSDQNALNVNNNNGSNSGSQGRNLNNGSGSGSRNRNTLTSTDQLAAQIMASDEFFAHVDPPARSSKTAHRAKPTAKHATHPAHTVHLSVRQAAMTKALHDFAAFR